jgi:hypothetical protein
MTTVTTPEGYRQRISALGLDEVRIGVNTVAEAKAALTTVRDMQKELRQIKREINVDMKTLRAHYAEKVSVAGEGSSALVGLFGKRGAASRMRADAKRRVRAERDQELAPYNNVKLYIDDLLTKMDGAKAELTRFMQDEKAKQQAEKARQQAEKAEARRADSSAVYCPACGKRVAKTDAFCRHCGTGL